MSEKNCIRKEVGEELIKREGQFWDIQNHGGAGRNCRVQEATVGHFREIEKTDISQLNN